MAENKTSFLECAQGPHRTDTVSWHLDLPKDPWKGTMTRMTVPFTEIWRLLSVQKCYFGQKMELLGWLGYTLRHQHHPEGIILQARYSHDGFHSCSHTSGCFLLNHQDFKTQASGGQSSTWTIKFPTNVLHRLSLVPWSHFLYFSCPLKRPSKTRTTKANKYIFQSKGFLFR